MSKQQVWKPLPMTEVIRLRRAIPGMETLLRQGYRVCHRVEIKNDTVMVARTPEVVEAIEFAATELEAHVGMAEVNYGEECERNARVLRQLLQQARGEGEKP